MPELPEVEVCRRGIEPELLGEEILAVMIRAPRLRHPIPQELKSLLPGCRVVGYCPPHHLVVGVERCREPV